MGVGNVDLFMIIGCIGILISILGIVLTNILFKKKEKQLLRVIEEEV